MYEQRRNKYVQLIGRRRRIIPTNRIQYFWSKVKAGEYINDVTGWKVVKDQWGWKPYDSGGLGMGLHHATMKAAQQHADTCAANFLKMIAKKQPPRRKIPKPRAAKPQPQAKPKKYRSITDDWEASW